MITQYTRVIIDDTSGDIVAATSQDFPFSDGWQPIELIPGQSARDFEIDADFPSSGFTLGRDQEMIRAREIIDNLEIVDGDLVMVANPSARIRAKIISISTEKPIEETPVRAELSVFIKAELVKGGSSETELIESIKKRDPQTPDTISELATVQLIRIKYSL